MASVAGPVQEVAAQGDGAVALVHLGGETGATATPLRVQGSGAIGHGNLEGESGMVATGGQFWLATCGASPDALCAGAGVSQLAKADGMVFTLLLTSSTCMLCSNTLVDS